MQSSFIPSQGFICKLTQLGIISVTGEDADSYLQGKLTIDVESLAENQVQLGCQCDFKGKTWNVFHAFRNGQQINMLSHTDSIAPSLAELKKFGVFSAAEFEDSSSQWVFFGGAGEQMESIANAIFDELPAANNELVSNSNGTIIRFDSPIVRYLMIIKKSFSEDNFNLVEQSFANEQYWEMLDIQAGIANVQTQTICEFVPQMMNLQSLDAINFEKGCYLGQEVVARTKYLGKNKRAAFILHSENEVDCQAGQTLEVKLGENWRRSGTVLRSAAIQSTTWLLAVLPNDAEPDQVFRLKEQPDVEFSILPLPYSID